MKMISMSKFVNVSLDEKDAKKLQVVKETRNVSKDAELLRILLREAFKSIPPQKKAGAAS